MESPLIEIVRRLDLLDVAVFMTAGILLLYCALSNRVYVVMFTLVLSASLVGTTIPVIESLASLVRWLSLLLLLATGLLFSRAEIPVEALLFWGYVCLGLVSMFKAISITWQLQRGLLLLVVAAAIPFGFGGRSFRTHRITLVLIAVIGALFAIMNAVALPSQLSDPVRFAGYSKAAPVLTPILGGLLPFVFWGLWNVESRAVRIILGVGFLSGMAALVLSAQRAGTIAGIVGLIPLTLATIRRKKNAFWLVLLGIVLVMVGTLVVQYASEEKISFLLSRYRLDSGLSDRDLIWGMALSEIANSPLLGQGIGAAEWVIDSSFHNAYLEVWFNAGFLGLVLFVASQVYIFLRIRYLNRILTGPEARSVLALVLGYMMGFVVLCTFESVGAGASNLNVILYLYLGVLVSGGALFEATSSPRSAGGLTPRARLEPAIVSDHQIALSS
jgi:O-antigen ligase